MSELKAAEREDKGKKARAVTACVLGCATLCVFTAWIAVNAYLLITAKITGMPEIGGKSYCLCAEITVSGEERLLARVARSKEPIIGAKLVYKLGGGYRIGKAESVRESGGKTFAVIEGAGDEILVVPDGAILGTIEETYPGIGKFMYGTYEYRNGILICAFALLVYEIISVCVISVKMFKEKRKPKWND